MLRTVAIAGSLVGLPVSMATISKVYAAQGEEKPATEGAVPETPPAGGSISTDEPKNVIKEQLEELKASRKDRTVFVNQLPLYGSPPSGELVYLPEKEDALREHVSIIRQAVWKQLDNFEGAWTVVKGNYRTTKKYAEDLARYLREDAGALPRATFITVSGLGGVVAGYKGGFVRKTLLAGAGMTGAAAVCYPEQAVDISRRSWILTKQQAKQLWSQATSGEQTGAPGEQKEIPENVTDKPPQTKSVVIAAPSGEADSKQKDSKDKIAVASKDQKEAKLEPKKDFGMSSEEDKTMYSTRTS